MITLRKNAGPFFQKEEANPIFMILLRGYGNRRFQAKPGTFVFGYRWQPMSMPRPWALGHDRLHWPRPGEGSFFCPTNLFITPFKSLENFLGF
jgi:hypothetical protein